MLAISIISSRAMGYRHRQAENPPNRFEAMAVEYDEGTERPQALRIYREVGKSFLTRNDSPDLPFRYSANPYRGCAHACAYCYARPYHEYLGFGAGTDFDTQIIAKVNAPELLRRELSSAKWTGEPIAFSGVTDCYQPAEAGLKLTRACLEVCAQTGNAAGVITKSTLIVRDIDVLQALKSNAGGNAVLSIPIADAEMARAIEPFAPSPEQRFKALAKLSAAGLRTGISLGPVIPGLTDSQIPELLQRAADAGAKFAFYVILRLPGAVQEVFLGRMREAFPDRVGKIEHHVRSMRGGNLYDSTFGKRMQGEGPMADMIEKLFNLHAARHGLEIGERRMELPVPGENAAKVGNGDLTVQTVAPKKAAPKAQMDLFDLL
jgi:DNA repair photolyase